ncbi:mechanosensitive ion channel family protein [Cyanobium sp. NIES-981]|uniref:mechanosensitive ion channel family protein n=1 Tax=Cyanobium sp. NIES-981 TaxID=1851505 RepID=UPI0007DD17B6|nr:mechanosensitive ion channel domain-containing protein [Cyanobium sp. NIES-981]SBO44953.1 Mechanosensitive ion channel family protein [Cyanobium sp. NIES-981]
MNDLLLETSGWLGYLERPAVLFQLLVTGLAVGVYVWFNRRRKVSLERQIQRRWVLLGSLALYAALLAALAWPHRLVVVVLLLTAGWFGLSALRRRLACWIPAEQLQQLDTGLLRPLYLLLAFLLLVQEVDSRRNLALIPMGSWFGTELTAGQLFQAVLVLYLLLMGSGPPTKAVARLIQRLIGVSDSGRRALALVLQYAIVALGVLWTLDQVGFNRTALVAVAGGLSVGLGFGVKEVFSNFISGLWLLFEGSVRPGDVLFIDGDPCEVRRLGLRAAVLWRDRDNAELVIPNQTFFTTPTITYTGTDRLRRGQVLVGAAYQHDPAVVIALLERTGAAVPGVLASPAPKGLVMGYGDSSIQYALRFWISDPLQNISISSAVNTAVWQAFRSEGIAIPFPQMVLHQAPGADQAENP